MPLPYTDGQILTSSALITVAGVPYVFNSLNVTNPVIEIGRNDISGRRAATSLHREMATFTAELQVNQNGQMLDLRGRAFLVDGEDNVSGEERLFYIKECSPAIGSGSARTMTITGNELLAETLQGVIIFDGELILFDGRPIQFTQ